MAESPKYYLEAALYDAAFAGRDEDLALYLEAAATSNGPVLELGAGSGRVTLALARSGKSVVAVDPSEAMLARLRAQLSAESGEVQARVSLLEARAENLTLPQRFSLTLATFNVVGHLETSPELVSFLSAARQLLAPGGQLLFDTLAPDEEELFADPDQDFELDPLFHPDTGAELEARERIHYEPESRILTATTTYKDLASGAEWSVPLRLRQWFPREIEDALREAGYARFSVRGDYEETVELSGADMFVIRAWI